MTMRNAVATTTTMAINGGLKSTGSFDGVWLSMAVVVPESGAGELAGARIAGGICGAVFVEVFLVLSDDGLPLRFC